MNRMNRHPHHGTARPTGTTTTSSTPGPLDRAERVAARSHDYTEDDNW